jgi:hydroxyacylglutathione hydrolase
MSARVIQIPVPNPYFEGDSNAYLIESPTKKLILIDTGIGTDEAFSHFETQLNAHSLQIQDISAILLTHKHSDHFGLAHRLQALAQMPVYVHEDDWLDVAHYSERRDAVAELYRETMLFWGIPAAGIEKFGAMRKIFDALAKSVPATKFRDNDLLRIEKMAFQVIHTPGHTQGSVCFVLEDKIFTGDHLLPHYTPNVGATDITVGQMLKKFLSSLDRIRPYAHLEAFPGHHHTMKNFGARLDLIWEHHKKREAKILELLSEKHPQTIFEIALKLFGTMREHHLLLGCGEVHAHLELLEELQHVSRKNHHYYIKQA